MRAVPLHLDAGSDLHHSLAAFAAQHGATGFVLSVVGDLTQACFRCPGQPQPALLQGTLEIITLQGTLAPTAVHLHLSVSDGHGQVWGGHLEPGTLVQKGADLLVGVLEQPSLPLPEPPVALASPPPPPAAGMPGPTPRLEILVRQGCPWCRRALRLLHTLAIPHRVHEAREPGPVPRVWIDGELIGGYDALVDLHARRELQALRSL